MVNIMIKNSIFGKALSKIGNFLNRLSIPYMIIGGQAVLVHGEPRLTKDIDITLGIGVEDSGLILNNLSDIN